MYNHRATTHSSINRNENMCNVLVNSCVSLETTQETLSEDKSRGY